MKEYNLYGVVFSVENDRLEIIHEFLRNNKFMKSARYMYNNGYSVGQIQVVLTNYYGVPAHCAITLDFWYPEIDDGKDDTLNQTFYRNLHGWIRLHSRGPLKPRY